MLPVLLLLVYADCCSQSKAACCYGEAFECQFAGSCEVEDNWGSFESNGHAEANSDAEANDQSPRDAEGQGHGNRDGKGNCDDEGQGHRNGDVEGQGYWNSHVESNAQVLPLAPVDIGEEGRCRSTNTSIVVPVVLVLEY